VVHEPVLAEVLAVVAGDDEHRVVEEPARAQPVDELADTLVGVADLGVVQAAEQLHVVGAHRDAPADVLERVLVDGLRALRLRSLRCRRRKRVGGRYGRCGSR
jgi:hypothetical protein